MGRIAAAEGDSEEKRGDTAQKAVIRRRNRTEFDHGHHLAVGFTENLALFEVPINNSSSNNERFGRTTNAPIALMDNESMVES
ncbi:hypothetical protein KUT41_18980 [Pseudomonas aeruginosa]|uniref:Uncharacterized protein n=2 Tax=Pseudomonas fluorescens group TaxID=136843 RepID=A0A0G4E5H1_PSEFS|nr:MULTISPECIES: hypothetical protein [Pseudomonas]ANN45343.1 hypothetical protein [uncultured bacterium]MDP9214091.1 hypothetical protein [Pseudomonadota bacterium]CEK42658.1 hypothetical protein PQBR44_0135 [Pseudomonas putida UWC1]ANN45410.1 hypothetical protein [uncultured bacterium]MBH3547397.1 hypothetical protein [Pseudomonas aeruginosa]